MNTFNGLSRVAGNASLYQSLLLELARQRQETSDALQGALADREQLARLAHTLRGAAGNLGVLEVASQAAELERWVRAGLSAPPAGCLARLLDTLAEVEGLIRSALEGWQPKVAVSNPGPGQPEDVGVALTELRSLARELQPD